MLFNLWDTKTDRLIREAEAMRLGIALLPNGELIKIPKKHIKKVKYMLYRYGLLRKVPSG